MTINFEDFFEAVWGYAPYPWQLDLSRTVCRDGTWPRVLDLPTGSGKTAVLDIALHHLIVDDKGVAPRRMIVVVDRRVIVDQVGQRAHQLLRAIGDERSDREPRHRAALERVRDRLAEISGPHAPLLHTEVLRGGTVRSDAWAAYPHVPVLAASTVDQVGSRLFFRGYGLSDRMRPIHAGLLGCDTLLFLDEVHLSRPFADVLEQLIRLRGNGTSTIAPRFGVVQLSATPGSRKWAVAEDVSEYTDGELPGTPAFALQQADREHPLLARVLGASKRAILEVIKVRARSAEGEKRQAVAGRMATHARNMIGDGRLAVAVVVNRVDTARKVWSLLKDDAFDRVLLTGRMRPLDQAAVSMEIGRRVAAGRERSPDDRPVVVVATQCIEAGADYDFDALITECASLDALRQRFGRLDRRGELSATDDEPADGHSAIVTIRSDQLGKYTDPVYQDALASTWNWLQDVAHDGVVDFGINALESHIDVLRKEDQLGSLLAPSPPAPVLLPAYLNQWCQTNTRPHADPEVSYFLHGVPPDLNRVQADVLVIWRADISEDELRDGNLKVLRDRVAMVPPGTMEAISLPLWAVRQWLSDNEGPTDTDDIADLEGVATASPDDNPERLVFCWKGREGALIRKLQEIVPGDMIVVPASYGGIGIHGTFDPAAFGGTARATDLGDLVQLRQRGRPTLRLDERVIGSDVASAVANLFPDAEAEDENVPAAQSVITVVRQALSDSPQHKLIHEILDALEGRLRLIPVPTTDTGQRSTGSWMIVGPRIKQDVSGQRLAARFPEVGVPSADGQEDESFTGSSTYLEDHLKNVGRMAEEFAAASGLADELVAAIRIAGDVHDIGKVDRRFQILLNGGDEIAARFGKPLAKSTVTWQDIATRNRAQQLAEYPRGQRHELVSLDMVERSDQLRARVENAGADWDLVLHLIASHHGWCRPFAPASSLDSGAGESVELQTDDMVFSGTTDHLRARVDSGVTKRFHDLVKRYGWHELAFLEAVLRLADHRQSELEVMHG